jgi:DNA polymerase-3 subunit epsilon
MREIVLDVETTGLEAEHGDRIVEIGCVEIIDYMKTGNSFHKYINPQRSVSTEALSIHGITDTALNKAPVFSEIVLAFLNFIQNSTLVIHNAAFDLGFLNMELKRLGLIQLPESRVVDTLTICRQQFPGAATSLDALCRRFGIDISARTYHGALLDAELLAAVYLELCGGRQLNLKLDRCQESLQSKTKAKKTFYLARPHVASPEEIAAHRLLLNQIVKPLWLG